MSITSSWSGRRRRPCRVCQHCHIFPHGNQVLEHISVLETGRKLCVRLGQAIMRASTARASRPMAYSLRREDRRYRGSATRGQISRHGRLVRSWWHGDWMRRGSQPRPGSHVAQGQQKVTAIISTAEQRSKFSNRGEGRKCVLTDILAMHS